MPVFVDEVVINLEVSNRPAGGAPAAPAGAADDKQALIAECVERVLEILRERGEP
jgi:hypothetical protein